jgi:hypothetical protein
MKIRDITEVGYGLADEPAPNVSRAQVRRDRQTPVNQQRRAVNTQKNANTELQIAQTQINRDINRDQRRRPTGIPNRAYMQQQQELQGRGQQ